MNNKKPEIEFAEKLENEFFGEFFYYPMHDNTIEKIWQNEENHMLLDKVLNSSETSGKAKFLACIVFFKKDIFFMQRHKPEKVAEIYVEALKNDYIGFANPWGLLYDEGEGPVGIEFLTIGKRAIPALSKLLDYKEKYPPVFIGSEEATIGAMRNLRIKDFAAWFIGRILGKHLKYYPDFESRDRQIEELKMSLKNY